jgi:hypothetical protein
MNPAKLLFCLLAYHPKENFDENTKQEFEVSIEIAGKYLEKLKLFKKLVKIK